jgi:hypothetical protein
MNCAHSFISSANLAQGDLVMRNNSTSKQIWIVLHIEKTKTLSNVTLLNVRNLGISYCNTYLAPDIFFLAKVPR